MPSPEPPPPAEQAPIDVLDLPDAGGLVVRGSVLRILGYGAGTLLSVLSAALLTRHLGVSRFGQYTTAISVATVTGSLTDAGVTSLATREFAQRRGVDRDQLMRDLLGLRVAITAIAVLLATIFAVAAHYESERLIGTALAAAGLGLMSIQTTTAVPLAVLLRLGQVTLLELLRQALLVGLIVVLILAGAGLLPLLAANVPVGVFALVLTGWLVRDQMPLRPTLRPAAWARLLRTTITFSLATGVGAAYVFAAQILTSLAASPHQNGIFAASFRVFAVVATSGGLIAASAFPILARAARDDHDRLAYAIQRLFEVLLLIGVAVGVATVTGAHTIIAIIAGHAYASAAGVLRIEALAMVASFMLATWGYALISLHRHRALVWANALALAAAVSLTLLLAPGMGARGSAIASVCAEWLLNVGYALALWRAHPQLRPSLGSVPRIVAAAVPALAVMLLGLPDAVQMIVALAVYAGAVVLLRAVPPELDELVAFRRGRRAGGR
jgi:O-antigen/teichoic acid export membrane protein